MRGNAYLKYVFHLPLSYNNTWLNDFARRDSLTVHLTAFVLRFIFNCTILHCQCFIIFFNKIFKKPIRNSSLLTFFLLLKYLPLFKKIYLCEFCCLSCMISSGKIVLQHFLLGILVICITFSVLFRIFSSLSNYCFFIVAILICIVVVMLLNGRDEVTVVVGHLCCLSMLRDDRTVVIYRTGILLISRKYCFAILFFYSAQHDTVFTTTVASFTIYFGEQREINLTNLFEILTLIHICEFILSFVTRVYCFHINLFLFLLCCCVITYMIFDSFYCSNGFELR